MPDPAVEAASRVWDGDPEQMAHILVSAAREALKPIRELHKRVHSFVYRDYGMCDECACRWPCLTAELIYTTEELA